MIVLTTTFPARAGDGTPEFVRGADTGDRGAAYRRLSGEALP